MRPRGSHSPMAVSLPDQPYGTESTALLRQLTRGPGQQLVLVFDDVDRYGRIVVQAWIGNLNINEEMVRRGAAWSESVYAQDDLALPDRAGGSRSKRGDVGTASRGPHRAVGLEERGAMIEP